MEDLLKNEEVRRKINGLSSPVKRAFIESLLDLYEQETEEMIDVIEESRMELRGDYLSFEEESKFLRAESRLLEDKRKGTKNESEQPNIRVKDITSRNSEYSFSYIDEKNSPTAKSPKPKHGKRGIPLSEMIARSQSTDIQEKRRSKSVITTRSLPTPMSLRTVEEEKEDVMKNLSIANQQKEAERQRQTGMIAQRREMKRQQKQTTEEKALNLLQKAVATDKILAEQRQEQDQKLKKRLEDMKKKQTVSRIGSRDSVDDNIEEIYKSKKIEVKESTEILQKQNETFEMIDKSLTSAQKIKADKPKDAGMAHNEKDKNDKRAADYDFAMY